MGVCRLTLYVVPLARWQVRIGHNGKGLGAGWHCDHVEVYRDTDPNHVWYFPCGNWFDKSEPPKEIVQTLPVAVRDANAAVAEYKITVYTSDVKCVRGRTPRGSKRGRGDPLVSLIMRPARAPCSVRLSGRETLRCEFVSSASARDACGREKSQAVKCTVNVVEFPG